MIKTWPEAFGYMAMYLNLLVCAAMLARTLDDIFRRGLPFLGPFDECWGVSVLLAALTGLAAFLLHLALKSYRARIVDGDGDI